ncbi:MAG TPA: AraC family transcriptional regulator [Aquamicrobium sp.]|nr:AraC family transcriptional regulator [Aquamicrobium sp.]
MSDLLKSIPAHWGPRFEDDSYAAAYTRVDPDAIEFEAPAHMALVMFTPQPGRVMALDSDRKADFLAPVGCLEIIPATAELYASWPTPKESLLVALQPRRLTALAQAEFECAADELQPPRRGFSDRKALLIAEMIRDELTGAQAANPVYLDSLLTVFSIHLLRHYSAAAGRAAAPHRGGLSARSWRDVSDYIQSNLTGDLRIDVLAKVAELSPGHFLRAFRQTVGQPPHRYILELRTEKAQQLILSTDRPLAEVAAACGFSSHSHLSSTMKRLRQTSPSALRHGSPG